MKPIKTVDLHRPNLDNFFFDENNNLIKDKGSIFDFSTCIRPGNKTNMPKIYIQKSSKTIIHNYGHYSFGWSLVFGSVDYSLQLFKKEKIPKTEKIVIIGAGCMGLYSAIALYREGYTNLEIISESLTHNSSNMSGAYFSPAIITNNKKKLNEQSLNLLKDLTIYSFKICKDIIAGKHFVTKGISAMDGYFGDDEKVGENPHEFEFLIEEGLMPEPEIVDMKFGNHINRMKKYKCIYLNPMILMGEFHRILKGYNIKITEKKVRSFSEVNSNYIFNCTGVGSRELANDTDIFPLTSIVIHLKNQDLSKFNYFVYTNFIPKDEKGKYGLGTTFNFLPKTDGKEITGLIVGAKFYDYYGKDEEKNQQEAKVIIKRAREFFGLKDEIIPRPKF